jgi:Predicted permeases
MMDLSLLQYGLGAVSGALVGFSLGLVGGGGSILAVPLIVYLVGVREPHLAIGTSAFAVATNAFVSLLNHARQGTVKWRIASLFAVCGIIGAFIGSTLGKAVDGQKLLMLFALLMMVIGALMLKRRAADGDPGVFLTRSNAPKLVVTGGLTGILSGFFGIGGGFMIVPSLMASTGMPIYYAVGSSLVGVTAFGLTTALNYALDGWVHWPLAAAFIAGGVLGSVMGTRLARVLSGRKGQLNTVFASLIFVVALYMLYRSAGSVGLIS